MFNDHFELTTKKSMSMLSFVKRQCYGRFNTEAVKILYSAIVRSHLEFASSTWAPHHAAHIQSLESVQRQFVLYANRDRYIDGNQNSYQLRPYLDRCSEPCFSFKTSYKRCDIFYTCHINRKNLSKKSFFYTNG